MAWGKLDSVGYSAGMHAFITDTSFDSRLRSTISAAWAVFARKVGSTLIPINKEASMQLQYAFVLKQLLPMALQHPDERAEIELEPGVNMGAGSNNIDILVHGASSSGEMKIAIELKCYRKIAASGDKRGAHDIFMKDVYEDLQVLEQYVAQGIATRGVALVMHDHKLFVNPRVKGGKCWTYDTSNGHTFQGGHFTVQVGSRKKPVDIQLARSYTFNWEKFGQFWFCELEGRCPQELPRPHMSSVERRYPIPGNGNFGAIAAADQAGS
ncbi:hypothetical protein [Comamonas sp. E6]|jgi:hypothetical protein|uniref:hypothetical protein n=1 Tax=Comamonas sp. E6 TaxID=364029 RepID=UPI000B209BC5|nr:hypothetical protein [Comamonas sp. E6]